MPSRLVATCRGIIGANVEQNSAQRGCCQVYRVELTTAGTLGDALDSLRNIAMHSTVYQKALRDDLLQFVPNSQGLLIKTYRGLAVTVDDGLSLSNGVYMTALFGAGAIGYAVTGCAKPPATN